jgi:hypothetical protein
MDQALTQLGVGGIFALLIVGKVLDFVERRRKNGSGDQFKKQIADLHKTWAQPNNPVQAHIGDLWQWHKPTDEGTQEWKNPRLAEAMESLSVIIAEQTTVMRKLTEALKRRKCLLDDETV